MQFNKKNNPTPAYGVKEYWEEALNAPGASQLIFLKNLIMSRPYFERVPAQDIVAGEQGEKYDYIAATRGKDYAFIYTWNGREFNINCGNLKWNECRASWYNPRNGELTISETFKCDGIKAFDPPGEKINGNDWVLILDRK